MPSPRVTDETTCLARFFAVRLSPLMQMFTSRLKAVELTFFASAMSSGEPAVTSRVCEHAASQPASSRCEYASDLQSKYLTFRPEKAGMDAAFAIARSRTVAALVAIVFVVVAYVVFDKRLRRVEDRARLGM